MLVTAWLMGLAALAGVLGAAGVSLAAVGAHLTAAPTVTTAAHFLLFHAAALVAICAVARDRANQTALLVAGSSISAGVVLFSGDLSLRALAGVVLFRLAAPTGGVLLIAGWAILAVALPFAMKDRTAPPPDS